MRRHNDPIADEVFRHRFVSIAEEMGVTLERTAYSPNIKERRDYSCAVFDPEGRLVAQAAHIPVHLGAFPLLMHHLVPRVRWRSGDVVITNDPFVGGTHLPDISLISPVFSSRNRLAGFVANRAHHADVGGAYPGSMAPTTEIYQEGVIIPPLKLLDSGHSNAAVLELLCRNVRTPEERRGDLAAQLAANATGVKRFSELLAREGSRRVAQRMHAAQISATRSCRELLDTIPMGTYAFTDFLDDDGHGAARLAISLRILHQGARLRFDFSGSAPQSRGPVNATLAVTHAAVYYCISCLLGEASALNSGTFAPLEIDAPEGSIVNAMAPAAVAAGNVETSQRIVDVVLGALAQAIPDRIPAASQGTMNNLTLGGIRPGTGEPWAYYETVGGGAGGSPTAPGISGAHSHMSNTRNTPAEALEYHYPVRVRRYALREGSGGGGLHRGGLGVVREVELEAPAAATLLTDRRQLVPYGLAGGGAGEPGSNEVAEPGQAYRVLPPKCSVRLEAGARLRISTPGGGGWGDAAD